MQAGSLFAMFIYVFILGMSVATVILFVRTRSKASAVMCAGVAIFWLGLALTFWGPKTTTVIERPPEGDVHYDVQLQTSKEIFSYMMTAGQAIFLIGFFAHAIGVQAISKSE